MIAQGVASGEFEVADLPLAALCTCTGMIRFFHPQMIAAMRQQAGPDDRPDDRFHPRRICAARQQALSNAIPLLAMHDDSFVR